MLVYSWQIAQFLNRHTEFWLYVPRIFDQEISHDPDVRSSFAMAWRIPWRLNVNPDANGAILAHLEVDPLRAGRQIKNGDAPQVTVDARCTITLCQNATEDGQWPGNNVAMQAFRYGNNVAPIACMQTFVTKCNLKNVGAAVREQSGDVGTIPKASVVKLCDRAELSSMNCLDARGSLTISMKIELLETRNPGIDFVRLPDVSLLAGLDKLYENGRPNADITLVTNGIEFPVHQMVLSVHSAVFSAMFNSDMREKQERSVRIEDSTARAVEQMVEYMYTGRCHKLTENAIHLLQLAEKYDIWRLKELAVYALLDSLRNDRKLAVHYYALGYQASDERLKVAAVRAFFDDRMTREEMISKWKELERQETVIVDVSEIQLSFFADYKIHVEKTMLKN